MYYVIQNENAVIDKSFNLIADTSFRRKTSLTVNGNSGLGQKAEITDG